MAIGPLVHDGRRHNVSVYDHGFLGEHAVVRRRGIDHLGGFCVRGRNDNDNNADRVLIPPTCTSGTGLFGYDVRFSATAKSIVFADTTTCTHNRLETRNIYVYIYIYMYILQRTTVFDKYYIFFIVFGTTTVYTYRTTRIIYIYIIKLILTTILYAVENRGIRPRGCRRTATWLCRRRTLRHAHRLR